MSGPIGRVSELARILQIARLVLSTRLLGVSLVLVGCGGTLTGGNKGNDGGPACVASGASCATSGCCVDPSDSCLAQGSDQLCLNAIPPRYDAGGACIVGLQSDLLGAALAFDAAPCSYSLAEIAAGIQIPYHEEIDLAVQELHPTPADAGGCQQPDAAGLIVGYQIAGGGQSYCVCDVGLCFSQTLTTATTVGDYYHQIPWDGRNWNGPSDTGNAEGAPFPVGTYTVTLTATGTQPSMNATGAAPFTLTATRTITITP